MWTSGSDLLEGLLAWEQTERKFRVVSPLVQMTVVVVEAAGDPLELSKISNGSQHTESNEFVLNLGR